MEFQQFQQQQAQAMRQHVQRQQMQQRQMQMQQAARQQVMQRRLMGLRPSTGPMAQAIRSPLIVPSPEQRVVDRQNALLAGPLLTRESQYRLPDIRRPSDGTASNNEPSGRE